MTSLLAESPARDWRISCRWSERRITTPIIGGVLYVRPARQVYWLYTVRIVGNVSLFDVFKGEACWFSDTSFIPCLGLGPWSSCYCIDLQWNFPSNTSFFRLEKWKTCCIFGHFIYHSFWRWTSFLRPNKKVQTFSCKFEMWPCSRPAIFKRVTSNS